MAFTPKNNIPYPDENEDPFYEKYVEQMNFTDNLIGGSSSSNSLYSSIVGVVGPVNGPVSDFTILQSSLSDSELKLLKPGVAFRVREHNFELWKYGIVFSVVYTKEDGLDFVILSTRGNIFVGTGSTDPIQLQISESAVRSITINIPGLYAETSSEKIVRTFSKKRVTWNCPESVIAMFSAQADTVDLNESDYPALSLVIRDTSKLNSGLNDYLWKNITYGFNSISVTDQLSFSDGIISEDAPCENWQSITARRQDGSISFRDFIELDVLALNNPSISSDLTVTIYGVLKGFQDSKSTNGLPSLHMNLEYGGLDPEQTFLGKAPGEYDLTPTNYVKYVDFATDTKYEIEQWIYQHNNTFITATSMFEKPVDGYFNNVESLIISEGEGELASKTNYGQLVKGISDGVLGAFTVGDWTITFSRDFTHGKWKWIGAGIPDNPA